MQRLEWIVSTPCRIWARSVAFAFSPVLHGSLARRARRSRRHLEQTPWWRRFTRHLATAWTGPGVSTGSFYALIIAALWSPLHAEIPALSDAKDAGAFLATIWTVEASILALSIAVIVFALQLFVSSAPGVGSLAEVARDSRLLWFIHLGIGGLLVDGLVLLHVGPDAPAKWPATWAAVVSMVSIPGLGAAVTMSLRAVDPGTLHQRRLARLVDRVNASVRDQMLERLATAHLDLWASTAHANVDLLLGNVPEGWITVDAPRTGSIADINLSRLASLKTLGQLGPNQFRVLLHVNIRSRVRQGRALCALPPGTGPFEICRASTAFRVRP